MQKTKDIQLVQIIPPFDNGCGLMQKTKDIQQKENEANILIVVV